MIGLAQGPGPCVTRRNRYFVNQLSKSTLSIVSSVSLSSSASGNCIRYNEVFPNNNLVSTTLSVSSLLANYEKEVLRLVGPLTAAAPIFRSAWSQ